MWERRGREYRVIADGASLNTMTARG